MDTGNKLKRLGRVEVEGAPEDILDLDGRKRERHAEDASAGLDRRQNLLTSEACEHRCIPRSWLPRRTLLH